MKRSARRVLTTGVAVVTAVTVAVAPSVKEPTTAPVASVVRVVSPNVKLSAAVQPRLDANALQPSVAQPLVAPASLPNLLVDWVQRIVVPPSASRPFPTPDFPPVVGGNSLQSAIINTYNAIEPWVQWGFEVAEYAVGWIPYVGWLAPQVMYFYNLGERIVRSITFNIADWIGGDISFGQGLVNVGIDTINSFISFANDQLAFWLPPLPPIPPIGPFAAAETAELTEPIESMAMMSADVAGDDVALIEETKDPGSTETPGDVVEGEEAAIETEGVDAGVIDEETQQIETVGTEEEATLDEEEDATLEEELAVEDLDEERAVADEVAEEEEEEEERSPPHPHPEPSRLRARSATPGSTPHPTRRPTTPRAPRRTTRPLSPPMWRRSTTMRRRPTTTRRRPTTTPARSKSVRRIQVAPQHQSGRQRAQHDEQQRCVLHDPGPAEHDVVAGSAERQRGHGQQPAPQGQRGQPRRGRPLQRRPHQCRVEQAAEQRADGKRHRSDTDGEKESGRYRGEDTVNR